MLLWSVWQVCWSIIAQKPRQNKCLNYLMLPKTSFYDKIVVKEIHNYLFPYPFFPYPASYTDRMHS
jgi:hypothetical protein